jgi:cytidyltransferase-like protein
LHPWVVIFAMASLLDHFLILVLLLFYYSIVFFEICEYTNLPFLTICRNVYVDGIFDLCHIGHKNLFKNALKFGNRLLVGVCSDEDATPYKRRPIKTTAERVAEVQGCRNVHEVIPNAPCNGYVLNIKIINSNIF